MEKKDKEQLQAEFLYSQTDLDHKQISDFLHIDRKTLYRWMKDGCWQRTRYITKHAPAILAEQCYCQLGELNAFIAARTERPFPTKEEAEIQRKLTLTISGVKMDRKCVIDNIEMMGNFMCELDRKDHAAAQSMVGHADDYIKSLLRERRLENRPMTDYYKRINEDRAYEEWASTHPLREPHLSASPKPAPDFTEFNMGQWGNDGATPPVDNELKTNENINSDTPENPQIAPKTWGNETHVTPTEPTPPTSPEPPTEPPTDDPSLRIPHFHDPEKRISPYRDGESLWVNSIFDLDERYNNKGEIWGEQKMGDRIYRYPPAA